MQDHHKPDTQASSNPEKSLTPRAASEYLGCKPKYIRVLIDRNELDGFKVGREYRTTPSAVARFQAKGVVK